MAGNSWSNLMGGFEALPKFPSSRVMVVNGFFLTKPCCDVEFDRRWLTYFSKTTFRWKFSHFIYLVFIVFRLITLIAAVKNQSINPSNHRSKSKFYKRPWTWKALHESDQLIDAVPKFYMNLENILEILIHIVNHHNNCIQSSCEC